MVLRAATWVVCTVRMVPCDCGRTPPSAPYTRHTRRLSRPPPIQKLGAENHKLQLNIQCSCWAVARHHPHCTHDPHGGSQDHHPSKNSVQKTTSCNSTSNAPDAGQFHDTIRTVHTTHMAALKTTTHPKTRCRKPYAATQHPMLLMLGSRTAPSAPYTRPTRRLSRPPPIQKLGAENHMLQLNI